MPLTLRRVSSISPELQQKEAVLRERLRCAGTPVAAAWTWLTAKLRIFQQPGLLRVEHGIQAEPQQPDVVRLQ